MKKMFLIIYEIVLVRFVIVIFKILDWWFLENKRENINSIY